ncbi:MAG: Urease accessory protein UreF [Frankiales bacterium]|nr:Urease accessory protein UreF [Frankiales bacterium]
MSTVPAALLLLADSRLPAGAHAHSGGVAAAVDAGRLRGLPELEGFLRGRLQTVGRTSAAAAAAAARLAARGDGFDALEQEVDARTPSPAARDASRAQGRGLARAVHALWPHPCLALLPARPHLSTAQGAAAVAAGAGAPEAAQLAALGSVTGPASAALRLLGLDPLRVAALLASLAPAVDDVAAAALLSPDLPACSAPGLDLLAQAHQRMEVRLFAS